MMAHEQGFVLPSLALATALLSLSIIVAADSGDGRNGALRDLRERLALEIAATTAEARLAHLLLTEPLDQRGLRVGGDRLGPSGVLTPMERGMRAAAGRIVHPLLFDGRAYHIDAGPMLQVEVQDEAGLVNLNSGDEGAVSRLLTRFGVAETKARHMAAALADYTDGDDLRRLNGVERMGYRRAGLPIPQDAPLEERSGVEAVAGWRDALSSIQGSRLQNRVAALPPMQRFNLNSAPSDALQATLGLDARDAGLILAAREKVAMQSLADVARLTGLSLAGGIAPIGGLPARQIRFRARIDRGGKTDPYHYEARLTFAEEGRDRPLIVEVAPLRRGPAEYAERSQHGVGSPFPISPALLAARKW
ncbi:hypothetical protein CLG96_08210 [Sphingomonas oleivorans]|uniref:T2SS protein K first SAM-like domain-containing protein n=1 Tax=Sphingomonas oleivorans TaxID=1735121 RepID=A0A2T5FY53_9SPHN|nr:type II secretion system protein GspK [Sphingomonas oleivorans]PTQ11424.1 hypothetical protein CLG96_08210 [Sphingomonas oleivorans]